MSYNDEPFTPDEVDEQLEQLQYNIHTPLQHNARLVQRLQQLYSTSEQANASSVENVWERLAQNSKNSNMQPDNLLPLVPLQTQWEKRLMVAGKAFSAQRRFIESIAAVLIVAILVGSLALALNNVKRNQQGTTYTNLPPVAGIYTATDTMVYKLDARTGARVWQYNSRANWLNLFYSTPRVVGNSVYAPSNNGLYVLNASTGKLLWKQLWAGNTITNMNVFPLIRGNVVLVSTVNAVSQGYVTPGVRPTPTFPTSSTLHALDTTTGKELWSKSFPLGNTIICTSCVSGVSNALYIISNSTLHAINLEDGSQSWNTPITEPYQVVLASESAVYLSNGLNGIFSSFDAESGKLLWSASLEQGYSASNFQVSNSILYLTASKSTQYYEAAYDTETGARLWKFPVDAVIKSEPFVSQNILYISAQNRYVYAVDAQSGKKLWSYHSDEDFYFSTMDNNIFYLEVGDAHTRINEHAMPDGKQFFRLHSIVALSKDGIMLKSYQVTQSLTPQDLVVGNGIIYLVAAPGPTTSFTFVPNDFVAFRILDGKQLWQQKLADRVIIGTIVVP